MTSYKDTAVLLIDPYNDYIHPEGKGYGLCKESLEETDTVTHMKALVKAARANNIPIFYCLHQQWKTGNFDGWNRMGPFHRMLKEKKVCEEGSWGAQIHKVSSFANTDLDYQLHQRNITKVITAGMTCNQCLEMTSRVAIELGYDVTVT